MDNKDIEEILDLIEELNGEINQSIGAFKAVADLKVIDLSSIPDGKFVLANKDFPDNLSKQRDILDKIYKIIQFKHILKIKC